MRLEFIECFLKLADTLNFTDTAHQLRLSQPTITRQIKLLEEQVGAQLFLRHHKGVTLTRDGEWLRNSLKPLHDGLAQVLESAPKRRSEIRGEISFACLPEIGRYFFFSRIQEFRRQYPEVTFHVRYCLQREIETMMRDGALDFGVSDRLWHAENFRTYRLVDERIVLVTRAQNNQDTSDPSTMSFLGYSPNDWQLKNLIARYYPRFDFARARVLSTVNSHHSMRQVLLSQDCFSVLPYFSIRDLVKAGRLKIVPVGEIRNPMYLVQHEQQYLPRRHELFSKFLLESCRTGKLKKMV